ncbi:MAG TPA: SRPBCC family protein [Solirubrobacteraceae bacterium]|nr:SRPBCC family protein [Solirubrobacteraceae bacterium]
MDPFTVSVTIARPREEVFEYLADIANHAEFTDHYLKDWHLTREDSYGRGAGARFRLDAPGNRFPWGDTTFVEVDPPYRIVEVGRGGKFNRIKVTGVYTLTPGAGGTTRVEFTNEIEPATLADRIMESFGVRGWLRRRNAKAMRRLRSILEDGEDRGKRATVAAG